MFSLFWKGAVAEFRSPHPVHIDTICGQARRESAAFVTSPTMPSNQALGMEPGLRRSASVKRAQPGPRQTNRQASASDSLKSPTSQPAGGSVPSPILGPTPVHRPKWCRIMTSFTAFFEILTKSVAIPTEVFKEAVAVACLVLGQEPEDGLAVEGELAASELIQLILGRAAGRRGENAVRMVLEGRTAAELKLDVAKDVMIDCCSTRGAVM